MVCIIQDDEYHELEDLRHDPWRPLIDNASLAAQGDRGSSFPRLSLVGRIDGVDLHSRLCLGTKMTMYLGREMHACVTHSVVDATPPKDSLCPRNPRVSIPYTCKGGKQPALTFSILRGIESRPRRSFEKGLIQSLPRSRFKQHAKGGPSVRVDLPETRAVSDRRLALFEGDCCLPEFPVVITHCGNDRTM